MSKGIDFAGNLTLIAKKSRQMAGFFFVLVWWNCVAGIENVV